MAVTSGVSTKPPKQAGAAAACVPGTWPARVRARVRAALDKVVAWGACPEADRPGISQVRAYDLVVKLLFFFNLLNWLWMSRNNFRQMATMDFGDLSKWHLYITMMSLLLLNAGQNFGLLMLMGRRHAWAVAWWGSSALIQFAGRKTFWPNIPADMIFSLKVLAWGHFLTWLPQIPLVLALLLPPMLKAWLWPSWPVQALRRTIGWCGNRFRQAA